MRPIEFILLDYPFKTKIKFKTLILVEPDVSVNIKDKG